MKVMDGSRILIDAKICACFEQYSRSSVKNGTTSNLSPIIVIERMIIAYPIERFYVGFKVINRIPIHIHILTSISL